MSSSKNGKYLVIDCETTGLHASQNGLIQFAALVLDSQMEIIDQVCSDVCPPENIVVDPVTPAIHGISEERIKNGISYSDLCELFLDLVKKHFNTGAQKPIVIGQFYPFDYSFLDFVFVRSGYHKSICKEILGNDFIDTKAIVNSLNLAAEFQNKPKPFPVTSLSKKGGLKEVLEVSDFASHDALGDCLSTRQVLLKLLKNYF